MSSDGGWAIAGDSSQIDKDGAGGTSLMPGQSRSSAKQAVAITGGKVRDRQLQKSIAAAIRKRELDQGLYIREFALLAGLGYSKARLLFRQEGFPCVSGLVFWSDFVLWRRERWNLNPDEQVSSLSESDQNVADKTEWPDRARRILEESK